MRVYPEYNADTWAFEKLPSGNSLCGDLDPVFGSESLLEEEETEDTGADREKTGDYGGEGIWKFLEENDTAKD